MEGNLEKAIERFDSRLDEAIRSFKEANADIKEAIRDNKESINETRKDFKEALDKVVTKAESSRRWAIGTVISIAIAVIGALVTFIIFLFNNGFQALT